MLLVLLIRLRLYNRKRIRAIGVPHGEHPARVHRSGVHLDEGIPRADPPVALQEREHPTGSLHDRHLGDYSFDAGDHVGQRRGEGGLSRCV